MFRVINLCGAEVNTKFSEQHRTHLLHSYIEFIIISFPLVVKSAKLSKIARDMTSPGLAQNGYTESQIIPNTSYYSNLKLYKAAVKIRTWDKSCRTTAFFAVNFQIGSIWI